MIAIIVAIARGGAIGRRGDQPFYIREDLRHFKTLTSGATVIMGRRTFEALPKGALPNRRNIVITRNAAFAAPGVEVAGSVEEAVEMAAGSDAFIIGGGEIYRQSLSLANRLYITEIDADVPDADTFFPPVDKALWILVDASPTLTDEPSGLTFRFLDYDRKL